MITPEKNLFVFCHQFKKVISGQYLSVEMYDAKRILSEILMGFDALLDPALNKYSVSSYYLYEILKYKSPVCTKKAKISSPIKLWDINGIKYLIKCMGNEIPDRDGLLFTSSKSSILFRYPTRESLVILSYLQDQGYRVDESVKQYLEGRSIKQNIELCRKLKYSFSLENLIG